MSSKPFWASRTIWANVVALAAMIATANGLDLGLTAEVQTQIVGGVMAVLNIGLRFITTEPVKVGKKRI